jgi:hypothetical protein
MTSGNASTSKSPYKDKALLIHAIKEYLTSHSAVFKAQGAKISEFFEMCCFNNVVHFYHLKGYAVIPKQLGSAGEFIYKLKANGSHENFSYFEVVKTVKEMSWSFDIHHNLSLECAHQTDIFYVADIAIVTTGTVKREKVAAYNNKRSYCPAANVQTFFEVKHMSPFPELLFSFTGILGNFFIEAGRNKLPIHLAPSLLISGNLNAHTNSIATFVKARYRGNVIAQLFARPSSIYSPKYSKLTIGSLP